MRILRAFVLLSVLLLARADADANADEQAAPESELPDFSKMRVKQLQVSLDCVYCRIVWLPVFSFEVVSTPSLELFALGVCSKLTSEMHSRKSQA